MFRGCSGSVSVWKNKDASAPELLAHGAFWGAAGGPRSPVPVRDASLGCCARSHGSFRSYWSFSQLQSSVEGRMGKGGGWSCDFPFKYKNERKCCGKQAPLSAISGRVVLKSASNVSFVQEIILVHKDSRSLIKI